MLDKEKLFYLNQKQKYSDIYKIFKQEYKDLLFNFFTLHDVEIVKEAPFSHYLEVLESKFNNEYKDVVSILMNAFLKEENSIFLPLSTAIDSYNYVKNRLN